MTTERVWRQGNWPRRTRGRRPAKLKAAVLSLETAQTLPSCLERGRVAEAKASSQGMEPPGSVSGPRQAAEDG